MACWPAACALVSSAHGYRKVFCAPGADATFQCMDLGEALRFEFAGCLARQGATRAAHDERLAGQLLERLATGGQRSQRKMYRVDDVAGSEIFRATDIDHHRAFAINQCHRILRGNAADGGDGVGHQ